MICQRQVGFIAIISLSFSTVASQDISQLVDAIISAPSDNVALSQIENASDSIAASSSSDGESYSSLAYAKEIYLQRFEVPEGTNIQLRESILSDYLAASAIAADNGRISHTDKIYEYVTKHGTYDQAKLAFEKLLSLDLPENDKYVGRVDYARTAAHFKDSVEAEKQFSLALAARAPVDAAEAHYLYTKYLLEQDRYEEALTVLDRYTKEERALFINLTLLRQKVVHAMKSDTTEVDREVDELRNSHSNSPFVEEIPTIKKMSKKNSLSLVFELFPSAHAVVTYSHVNNADDSRGPNANQFMMTASGSVTRSVVNMAEVLYHEARGESFEGQIAVAWAIRNRAYINMNGCDFYQGSLSNGNTSACKSATPVGPQAAVPEYGDAYRRYSCVIHGGTSSVGGVHSQMNDAHVSSALLDPTGLIGVTLLVINGWYPDITSASTPSGSFNPGGVPGPIWLGGIIAFGTGNPAGAQEWRSQNYCAARPHCKVRLGNVGGDLTDPGDTCPPPGDLTPLTDNFFYGRKP